MADASQTRSRKSALLAALFLAAAALTIASYKVQRVGPETGIYGNVCGPNEDEPCTQELLKGGFPFAFLFDNPGVSVRGQLSLLEDHFYILPFIADAFVFGSVVWIVVIVIRSRVNRPGPTPQR